MAELQLVQVNEDGSEVILEITPVPDDFCWTSYFFSLEHISRLKKHYERTGKPKKSYIDAIYIIREQVERQ